MTNLDIIWREIIMIKESREICYDSKMSIWNTAW